MKWFLYEPAEPCRPSVYGEGIYIEHWQRIMREPIDGYRDFEENERFASIVSPFDPIADDAIAASSFVCWLGTNVGRGFLLRADEMRKKHSLEPEHAYLLAWAIKNERHAGINCSKATLEAILPPNRMTTRAMEVVHKVVRWLGSPDGQRLIKGAEAEIVLTGNAIRDRHMMQARIDERARQIVSAESGVRHG